MPLSESVTIAAIQSADRIFRSAPPAIGVQHEGKAKEVYDAACEFLMKQFKADISA